MKKWPYWVFPLIALGVGALAGFLIRDSMQEVYPMLEKSALTPPAMVFPIVWTILYVLMGWGMAMVYTAQGDNGGKALWIWGAQLAVNFLWSLLFFNQQQFLWALVLLLGLWLLILWMMVEFHRIKPIAAWLQLPYLLWVSFAAYLNYAVWVLNA
ncbi:MAG: TspO/MBR family protein [Eubacteriales bacterium]